jgi:hypothetical protein
MERWIKMLDALNAHTGLSDRKLGPLFGLGEGAVTHWRSGRGFPDDETAVKISELLKLDLAYVLAVISAARAKTDSVRSAWTRIAEGLSVIFLAVGVTSGPAPAGNLTITGLSSAPNTHCVRRRWLDALA